MTAVLRITWCVWQPWSLWCVGPQRVVCEILAMPLIGALDWRGSKMWFEDSESGTACGIENVSREDLMKTSGQGCDTTRNAVCAPL